MTDRENLWKDLVLQTRRYGSTYCPVSLPTRETIAGITYSQGDYGRSRLGGGHKHKAYAHSAEGNVVSSYDLFGVSDPRPR